MIRAVLAVGRPSSIQRVFARFGLLTAIAVSFVATTAATTTAAHADTPTLKIGIATTPQTPALQEAAREAKAQGAT